MPNEHEELPPGAALGVVLPVIFDLEFLPYFPAHAEFLDHSNHCVQCHTGAFHRDQLPPDLDEHDLLCETGLPLMEAVREKVGEQRHMSLLN